MEDLIMTSVNCTDPISVIYKDYLNSQNIGDIDTSDIDKSCLKGDALKNVNTLISSIMENVSSNDIEGVSIRNTARLFSYIINGTDPDEPAFEDLIDVMPNVIRYSL
jgi:hypothetical protein